MHPHAIVDPSRQRRSAAPHRCLASAVPAATTLTFASAIAYRSASGQLARLTDAVGKHLKRQRTATDLATESASVTLVGVTVTHDAAGVAGTVKLVVMPGSAPCTPSGAKSSTNGTASTALRLFSAFMSRPVRLAVGRLFKKRALETAARLLCADFNQRCRLRPGARGYRAPCKVSTNTGIKRAQILSQVLGLLYREVARRANTRGAMLHIVDLLAARPRDLSELYVVRDLVARVKDASDTAPR